MGIILKSGPGTLLNLTFVEINNIKINVTICDRGNPFQPGAPFYVEFYLDGKITLTDDTDLNVSSIAVLRPHDNYPKGTPIGAIGAVKPSISYSYDAYLNYTGRVADIQPLPRGVNPYTKDLQIGKAVSIDAGVFEFVLTLFPDNEWEPSVGDTITGTAKVYGIIL